MKSELEQAGDYQQQDPPHLVVDVHTADVDVLDCLSAAPFVALLPGADVDGDGAGDGVGRHEADQHPKSGGATRVSHVDPIPVEHLPTVSSGVRAREGLSAAADRIWVSPTAARSARKWQPCSVWSWWLYWAPRCCCVVLLRGDSR